MSDKHTEELAKHCRVCGLRLQKTNKRAPSFPCSEKKEEIELTFAITINDDDKIYPNHFCSSCYLKTKRKKIALEQGQPYNPIIPVFSWTQHTTPSCEVRCKVVSD